MGTGLLPPPHLNFSRLQNTNDGVNETFIVRSREGYLSKRSNALMTSSLQIGPGIDDVFFRPEPWDANTSGCLEPGEKFCFTCWSYSRNDTHTTRHDIDSQLCFYTSLLDERDHICIQRCGCVEDYMSLGFVAPHSNGSMSLHYDLLYERHDEGLTWVPLVNRSESVLHDEL